MRTACFAFADGVSVDTALSNRGVNPSIGEVSLGLSASLSMGSGTHLDRVGDRETASTAACAGSIASGTLSTAHKVELQTDASSNKRFSLSSHCETASATLSFGDRSANISYMDDASIKALAGSINGYKEAVIGYAANSVTPVEIHAVDQSVIANVENESNSLNITSEQHNIRKGDDTPIVDHNYVVTYIDDTPSPCELASEKHLPYTSQTKNLIGKFESRSLEHLTNYCELCHKSHRPCCPNVYKHQTSKTSANSSRKHQPNSDETRKNYKKSSNVSKRRTSSTKSRHSGSTTSDCYKELKRVHSSECNITDSRINYEQKESKYSLTYNSTPSSTMAVNDETVAQFRHHSDQNNTRAYNQNSNSFSKCLMQNKAIEQKPIKEDIRPKHTTITINDNELNDYKEFYIKSSEV